MQKLFVVLVAITITVTSAIAQRQLEIFPNCIAGNVDGDTRLTINDVNMIIDHIEGVSKLSCESLLHADVNRDRLVDEADVEALLETHDASVLGIYAWGDINGDGFDGVNDLILLEYYISSQGTVFIPPVALDTGDIDADGALTQNDLEIFLNCESGILDSPFDTSRPSGF